MCCPSCPSQDPGPCERRVDGDRVTEMVPAGEWLAQAKKNGMILDPDGVYPPRLPRHQERDHLHDNTRAHAVFDPANPGLTTYVRVTRRVNIDRAQEDLLREERKAATKRDLEWEAMDQAEKVRIGESIMPMLSCSAPRDSATPAPRFEVEACSMSSPLGRAHLAC